MNTTNLLLNVLTAVLVNALFLSSYLAALTAPPSDRLIVFDENQFDGSPRGFFEVGFNGPSQFITNVGSTSSRLLGFTYHPADRYVYAGTENGQLWRVDPTNGVPNLLGHLGLPFIAGLTTSFVDGTIYGAGPGPSLYKIDPATLTATVIGPRPFLQGGMAASPNGIIYFLTDTATKILTTIDPTSLAVVSIGPINAPPISDLTFTSDGRLFGVHWENARVYEIDPLTGTSTLIATLPNNRNGAIGIFAIPLQVPEPTSFVIFFVYFIGCLIFLSRASLRCA